MNDLSDNQLYNLLKEYDIVDRSALDEALKETENGKSLYEILTEANLVDDESMGKIAADYFRTPFIKLKQTNIEKEVLEIIPEIVAKKQLAIAFEKGRDGVHVASCRPDNKVFYELISKKTGLRTIVHYATKNDILEAMNLYSKDVEEAFDKLINLKIDEAGQSKNGDLPIIKIVDTLVSYGYKNKASDIHIEPTEGDSVVRFRIDGVLHDVVEFPKRIHEQVVTRIKVLSKLRTDEHQTTQDGKFQFKTEDGELDLRVSIVPIVNGEKIVMRLLSNKNRELSLVQLGFSEADFRKVEQAYEKPYGMILSTGPTGSGKTTTLYAILKILNQRDVNIMTIEDPVEYEVDGVNQVQVNQKTGISFADGLRSIVRQDPDIILVGEIRDSETAGVATNFAMTGHLVLSTLHTNDAATALPRLIDMGIEPFLVASSVNCIVAQRLVRQLCPKCRYSTEITENELNNYGLNEEQIKKLIGKRSIARVYKGKGCPVCHKSGYVGRIGIFEVLEIDDEIREAITNKLNAGEIEEIAMKKGMKKMFEDGIEKVKNGLTTIDELLRVTKV